jgi:hypothetical protein
MLGGVGGLTGGWENRGPDAIGSNDGAGVDVLLAAGLAEGPTTAQPARKTHSRAATVSRTGRRRRKDLPGLDTSE